MSHDADLVAKVAKAIDTRPACDHERANYGNPPHEWLNCTECDARAVLDALDVPGLIRAAKAEALTEAADDMERIFRAGNLLGGPTDDWLRLRAAEIDPEEGDHE